MFVCLSLESCLQIHRLMAVKWPRRSRPCHTCCICIFILLRVIIAMTCITFNTICFYHQLWNQEQGWSDFHEETEEEMNTLVRLFLFITIWRDVRFICIAQMSVTVPQQSVCVCFFFLTLVFKTCIMREIESFCDIL